MPNHFHLVLWPRGDGDLSPWMHWLLTSHVRRYFRHYRGTLGPSTFHRAGHLLPFAFLGDVGAIHVSQRWASFAFCLLPFAFCLSGTFPIQQDEHLLSVVRYVERNPLRAGLVERAQDWRWSSLPADADGPSLDP